MPNGRKVDLTAVLMAIMTIIATAGIPWAYTVNARLVRIEAKMERATGVEVKLLDLENRLTRCEAQLKLEP